MFGDEHWAKIPGGAMVGEISGEDGNEMVYLAMSLHNAGQGVARHPRLAVLPGPAGRDRPGPILPPRRSGGRRRDLYIPVNDTGFWQAAYRDQDDPEYAAGAGGHQGQDAGGHRPALRRSRGRPARDQPVLGDAAGTTSEGHWVPSVIRHWNIDRPDPRYRPSPRA